MRSLGGGNIFCFSRKQRQGLQGQNPHRNHADDGGLCPIPMYFSSTVACSQGSTFRIEVNVYYSLNAGPCFSFSDRVSEESGLPVQVLVPLPPAGLRFFDSLHLRPPFCALCGIRMGGMDTGTQFRFLSPSAPTAKGPHPPLRCHLRCLPCNQRRISLPSLNSVPKIDNSFWSTGRTIA